MIKFVLIRFLQMLSMSHLINIPWSPKIIQTARTNFVDPIIYFNTNFHNTITKIYRILNNKRLCEVSLGESRWIIQTKWLLADLQEKGVNAYVDYTILPT